MAVKYKFLSCLVVILTFLFLASPQHAFAFSLSGKMSDGQGHYIGFANFSVYNAITGVLVVGGTSNTDTGNYSATLGSGTYNINVSPLSGAYQQKTISNVVISSDTVVDIVLDPAPGSVALSGKILTPENSPVSKISIALSSSGGGASYKTSGTGEFFLRVFPRSDYTANINNGRGTIDGRMHIPNGFQLEIRNININQNIIQDIIIPTVNVAVHIQKPDGSPASNVSVGPEIPASFIIPTLGLANGSANDNGGSITDTNGNLTLYLLPTGTTPPDYTITAVPNSGPYFDSRLITNEEIIEGKTFNLTLSALPTLSGRFHNLGNSFLPNIPIEIKQNNTLVANITTNSKGEYYLKIPLGNYQIRTWSNTRIPNGPESFEITGDLALTQSKQVSFSLANYVVPVSVIVKDANSNMGVPATISSQGPNLSLSVFGLTNVIGRSSDTVTANLNNENKVIAQLKLFRTGFSNSNAGYTINVAPTNTNYLPNAINDFKFDGGTQTTILIQTNQPPVVNANGPYTVNEGNTISLQGTATDPDNDTLSYSWDLDNNGSYEQAGQEVIFHGLNGTATTIVGIKACDIHQACDTDSTEITILNVAPNIVNITPIESVLPNTIINASAVFEDQGVNDLHTAIWDWGDSNTSAGTVLENNGSGTVTGNHSYLTPGTYTVTLTVSDGTDNNSKFSTIIILTPSQATQDLVEVVQTFNLQQGIQNSLDAKLDSALSALDDVNTNNDQATINSLNAFINAVEAQRGTKITEEQANILISEAQKIIQYLNL